jgi:hypothetical protein
MRSFMGARHIGRFLSAPGRCVRHHRLADLRSLGLLVRRSNGSRMIRRVLRRPSPPGACECPRSRDHHDHPARDRRAFGIGPASASTGAGNPAPLQAGRRSMRSIAPGSPWQNGFAERLIGSIRRECVDHIVVLGEAHLLRVLMRYAAYYNAQRTHRSLGEDAPIHRAIQHVGRMASVPVLGGLHHHYCRI